MMGGFLSGALLRPRRHFSSFFKDFNYREFKKLESRYSKFPRFTEIEVPTSFGKLLVPDTASFLSAFEEIFVKNSYLFRTLNQTPNIIDCGANIGLSVIYFKRLYPESKIIAFEPDLKIAAYLEENIRRLGLNNIDVQKKAVWKTNEMLPFLSEGADGGRIDVDKKSSLCVECVRLRSFLDAQIIDFLKIDIEGAEIEVIKDCADALQRVGSVFVEFHSFSNRLQELGTLLSIFEKNGFRAYIHSPFSPKHPFIAQPISDGMDMRLNLFFSRDPLVKNL